jgi:hypothetical protein
VPLTVLGRFLLLLTISFFTVSCVATKSPIPENKSYPLWVLNPDKHGYESVVAAAPKQVRGGRESQYRVAQLKAYQELAQRKQVQVISTNLVRIEDRGGKVTQNMDVETTLQSDVALDINDTRVIEEWVDPENGDLYIWLVVPK